MPPPSLQFSIGKDPLVFLAREKAIDSNADGGDDEA